MFCILLGEINRELLQQVVDFRKQHESEKYGIATIRELIEMMLEWYAKDFVLDTFKIALLSTLQTKLAVWGCEILYPFFCELYQQTYSLRPLMSEYKERLWMFFENTMKQNNTDIIVVKHVCEQLRPVVLQNLAGMYQKQLQASVLKPLRTKRILLAFVLKSLAENKVFDDYVTYFAQPKMSTVKTLKEYITATKSAPEMQPHDRKCD